VYLPYQPERQRQTLKAVEAVEHRSDIVDDLFDVLRQAGRPTSKLEHQHIVERALCAFDLRTEDRFPPNVHGDEELRVWQVAA